MRTEDKQKLKELMNQMIDESGDESLGVCKKVLVDFRMYEKASNVRDIEAKYKDSPEAKHKLDRQKEAYELSKLLNFAGIQASPEVSLTIKEISSHFEDVGSDMSISDIESIKELIDNIFN